MKKKGTKVWKYFVVFLIFASINPINALNSYYHQQTETKKQISTPIYPSIEKIKKMLPQNIHESLKKNLLESVVKMVFEQIDKDFYNFKENNKKDINFIFKTLDQYNIVEEFENTIATTVFDSNDYVFVFVGNAPDLKNYQIYLQQKKANFQTPRGVFWRNWQPANMIFVSKKHIQFLINILQQIISLEMENHLIHKNTNFDTNAESIRNFQINIQNNRQQINKLKNELGRERCLNISINNEMLDLQ